MPLSSHTHTTTATIYPPAGFAQLQATCLLRQRIPQLYDGAHGRQAVHYHELPASHGSGQCASGWELCAVHKDRRRGRVIATNGSVAARAAFQLWLSGEKWQSARSACAVTALMVPSPFPYLHCVRFTSSVDSTQRSTWRARCSARGPAADCIEEGSARIGSRACARTRASLP